VDEHAETERGRPDTSPVEGVRPELLAALVLRRALRGGVAKAGPIYVDYGYRMGRHLTGTFTELIEGGSLALAEENCGLRRVWVTDAGRAHYAQVRGILRWDRR
jgi:hypothetical protein